MDNVISSTLLPGVSVSVTEKPVSVLPEELPSGIKPGDTLLLEAIIGSDAVKSGSLLRLTLSGEHSGLSMNVKLQSPLRLEAGSEEVRRFSGRVMNDGSLQLVPLKDSPAASGTLKAGVPAGASAGEPAAKLPNITFQPLKIAPVIDNLMTGLNFPPSLKAAVSAALPQTEIIIALKDINPQPQIDQAFLAPLKNVLSRMPAVADRPQQLTQLVQELVQAVRDLGGKTFPAQLSDRQPQNNAAAFETPLGRIWSEQPLKLPPDTTLQLEVRPTVITSSVEDAPLLKKAAEMLARLLPPEDFVRIRPENLLQAVSRRDDGVSNLLKVFEPLLSARTETAARLSAALLQKIPGLKADMLQNMYVFYRAAEKGDSSRWLGPELRAAVIAEAPRGAETVARLDNMVAAAVRETPLWRIIEIPFFDGSQLLPLQVALKKEPEEEKKKQSSKNGLRFMVNTEFSKLGAFQFDGFSVAAERRFDLIIRTSQIQDNDFCAQIINLFKKSLHDVGYIGSIRINQREAFVQTEPPAAPREGMYV